MRLIGQPCENHAKLLNEIIECNDCAVWEKRIKKSIQSSGGKARALKLTKARRLEISRLANAAKKLKALKGVK